MKKFFKARYLENENGKPAIVTKFKDGEPVGMVPLSNFVFATNPRYLMQSLYLFQKLHSTDAQYHRKISSFS